MICVVQVKLSVVVCKCKYKDKDILFVSRLNQIHILKRYIVADNSKHITNSTQRENKYKPKENKERGT